MSALQRVAVIGATGAVGSEVVDLLEARRFPLQELLPIATDDSVGNSVSLLGQDVPIETEGSLRGFDLAFLCTPRSSTLPWMRQALAAKVPCVDLSAAALETDEVPLLAAELSFDAMELKQPVVASPSGPALAWSLVLAPILAEAGLERVVGTALEAASGAGRAGIEALEQETRALFNQWESPEPRVFPHALAFDCLPSTEAGVDESEEEQRLVLQLHRLLRAQVPTAATVLRAPTFAGAGATLSIETEKPLDPAACAELLDAAPGVSVLAPDDGLATTRESVGEEHVSVSRLRRDPSRERGLLLWLAADPIRLAATNALRLAEARLE